ARRRARRHDRPLPRAQFARRRFGAETPERFHRAVDRQDHARAVWPVAAEMDRIMRRLRVLVLMHSEFVPPDSMKGYSAQQVHEWKTEYDVVSTLRAAGHEVQPLGVAEELKPVREAIEGFKPHVAFHLLEKYQGEVIYDQNV